MKVSIWTAIVTAAACCGSVLGGAWMLAGELGELRATVRVLEERTVNLPPLFERFARTEARVDVLERRADRRITRDTPGE